MNYRVDAIDPAGPNFDFSPSSFQLAPTNAEFVHVMHCNMALLGSKQNRGTIDFYPNGGDNLPGCEYSVARGLLSMGSEKHVCNHVRCIDLYIELLDEEQVGCLVIKLKPVSI